MLKKPHFSVWSFRYVSWNRDPLCLLLLPHSGAERRLLLCLGGECCEWDWLAPELRCPSRCHSCVSVVAAASWQQHLWSHFSLPVARVSSLCVSAVQWTVTVMGWSSSGCLLLCWTRLTCDRCGLRLWLHWRIRWRVWPEVKHERTLPRCQYRCSLGPLSISYVWSATLELIAEHRGHSFSRYGNLLVSIQHYHLMMRVCKGRHSVQPDLSLSNAA